MRSALNEALENDPTKDLIAFLREESRHQVVCVHIFSIMYTVYSR